MERIEYPALAPYAERCTGLAMRPLRVSCRLKAGAQLAQYDPPNVDNLLAWAVVQEATAGAGLPPEAVHFYALPVPLRALWVSPFGVPLYAATPLLPVGQSAADVCYIHKRTVTGRWIGTRSGRFDPQPIKGRWMERQIPQPTVLAEEFACTVVGNAEEIARLLQGISFIGKRRHVGFGEVERWRVEPVGEFALETEGRLTRSVPLAAWPALMDGRPFPGEQSSPVAWAPPQWKASLYLPGWRWGTPVG